MDKRFIVSDKGLCTSLCGVGDLIKKEVHWPFPRDFDWVMRPLLCLSCVSLWIGCFPLQLCRLVVWSESESSMVFYFCAAAGRNCVGVG